MGEKHHLAKLTAATVRAIRENRRGRSFNQLAAEFWVSLSTIKRVRWGLTWRHVD